MAFSSAASAGSTHPWSPERKRGNSARTPEIGFALSSEDHGPSELVEQAAIAEQAGFTFAVISDHYHPWIRKQERTKEEGKRRLQRPALEEMSTALAAGFDIVAGIVVLALLVTQLEHHFGKHAAHVVGALGFGVGFIFLIVGRGELFTENFLVPIAGLDDEDDDSSWLSLLKLYLISPVFNVVGGLVIILILSTHSVLPYGTGRTIADTGQTLHANGVLALFMSAVFAGALVTAMTWFVEGQATMMPRIVVAWLCGALLALGSFNHVIVVTLELIFGYRYGAHYHWIFILGNFGLAAAGNIVGGVGLVTLNRLTQGKAGNS